MRIIAINSYNHASTGNIARGILDYAKSKGHEVHFAYPNAKSMKPFFQEGDILIGNRLTRNIHILLAYISGLHGFFSILDTYLLIRKFKEIKPDCVHIHNLHGDYINIPLLFRYLKKQNIPTVITMHDCWNLTGHCFHFSYEHCDKWKTGCYKCAKLHTYPKSLIDMSRLNYWLKKRIFTYLDDVVYVTPSKWLFGIAKQSFLKNKRIEVINNGIDLHLFKRIESNVKNELKIEKAEKIILFVSFSWTQKKGVDVINHLRRMLSDKYHFIVIGNIDNPEYFNLPGITYINRTSSKQKLIELYSAADLLINPTREEVLGMVNIEALACGCPVVTFEAGGSPECITRETGMTVPIDDVSSLRDAVISISLNSDKMREACFMQAKRFDQMSKYKDYLKLIDQCVNRELV